MCAWIHSISWWDLSVLAASAAFALVGVLHDLAGLSLYLVGCTGGVPEYDHWKVTTRKQGMLLGVFFCISVAWWQVLLTSCLLIVKGNSLGGWLGVINILFQLPQLGLLMKMVGHNKFGNAVGLTWIFYIVVYIFWTTHQFSMR